MSRVTRAIRSDVRRIDSPAFALFYGVAILSPLWLYAVLIASGAVKLLLVVGFLTAYLYGIGQHAGVRES